MLRGCQILTGCDTIALNWREVFLLMPSIAARTDTPINYSIDELMEEDKIRTALGTISLSSSNLAILNSDGLQPKLASDLGQL